MDDDTRDLALTTAVFLGALILFGPLTYAIVVVSADVLLVAAGLGGLAGIGIAASALRIIAVLVAGEIVTEISAVQLHGAGALWRGPRWRRLARHALLWVVIAAGVGLVLRYVVAIAPDVLVAGNPSAIVLTALTVVALGYAAVRTAIEFRSGLAGEE